MKLPDLSRRDCLRLVAANALGSGLSGWFKTLAADAAALPVPQTFLHSPVDEWRAVSNGHLRSQARTPQRRPIQGDCHHGSGRQDQRASSRARSADEEPGHHPLDGDEEGDHARATHLLHTGNLPQAPIEFPALGAAGVQELGKVDSELPNFVAIGRRRFDGVGAPGSGFLGPDARSPGHRQQRPGGALLPSIAT